MRVEVYWNLHKHCFSVRHKGRVIKHTNDLQISNPRFIVRPAGRARVLREGRKNVHAFVRGELTDLYTIDHDGKRVTYNPYKYDSFVYADSERSVHSANMAYLRTQASGKPVIFAV